MNLSILVPTIWRPSLSATLASIHPAEGDEVVLLATEPPPDRPEFSPEKLSRLRVLVHPPTPPELATAWYGHQVYARNWVRDQLCGDYVVDIGDDDVFVRGGLERIRAGCVAHRGKCLVYRMVHHWIGYSDICPREEGLRFQNIGSQNFVYPNDPKKMGTWYPWEGNDLCFIMGTLNHYRPQDLIWVLETVMIMRPQQRPIGRGFLK